MEGERLNEVKEIEKSINMKRVVVDRIRYEMKKDASICKRLEHVEAMLEVVYDEIARVVEANIEHEWMAVQDDNELYIVDFTTGRKIPVMSRYEYECYVNRRSGMKVFNTDL